MAAAIVFPHIVVNAVVEIEIFQMLEFGLRSGKQLGADLDVVVHRTADVEKQQHLDLVVAFRPHLDVEPARIARRAVDGAVQVELFCRALAGEAAQPTQRDLDIARAEFDVVIEIAVFAGFPHLDGRAVARRFATDADAFWMVAVVAKRAGTTRAYPFVAAFVARLLFFQTLLELLHQLVPAERFQDGFVGR